MKTLSILICTALIIASGSVLAHSYIQGDIHIGHIWTRATPSGATTAAIYAPLLNVGTVQDKLTGASTDLADKVEIHQDTNDNNIMRMQKLDAIVLEPNKPVTLSPGGIHLMVFGLKQPLKEGDKLPLTLQFEKAGIAKVDVMVEGPGARAFSGLIESKGIHKGAEM